MIQANELRIGNWILADLGLPSLMPHKISCGDFRDLGTEKLKEDMLTPIQLTEEILLKCGFSSPINGWYTSPNKTLEFGFNGEGKLILMDWFLEITSLHQLQNLYFALTNTELEINL